MQMGERTLLPWEALQQTARVGDGEASGKAGIHLVGISPELLRAATDLLQCQR